MVVSRCEPPPQFPLTTHSESPTNMAKKRSILCGFKTIQRHSPRKLLVSLRCPYRQTAPTASFIFSQTALAGYYVWGSFYGLIQFTRQGSDLGGELHDSLFPACNRPSSDDLCWIPDTISSSYIYICAGELLTARLYIYAFRYVRCVYNIEMPSLVERAFGQVE